MKKKKIIIPVCVILIVCLIGGSVFTVTQFQASKKTINVVPVSNISTYDTGNFGGSDGLVTSDVNQTIYLQQDQTIKEIYVQQGDTVTVGTPLIQYDTKLIELDLETKQMELQGIDIKINQAQENINSLKKGVVPSGLGMGGGDFQPEVKANPSANDRIMTASAVSNETQATAPSETNPPETTAPETTAPETTAPETDEPQTDVPETNPPETQAPEESETVPETNPPKQEAEEKLDEDFDFSKYENPNDPDAQIRIPCNKDTVITPEFINMIRGKNPDGTEIPEDPQTGEKPAWARQRDVVLLLEDMNKYIHLDGSKLERPYVNTVDTRLEALFSQEGQLTVEIPEIINKEFFDKYPLAQVTDKPLKILCNTSTQIDPSLIYILCGRKADGTQDEAPKPLKADIVLEDIEKVLSLDGETLRLPYVTSIPTAIADFIANEYELNEVPVSELTGDTVLDHSPDHHDVYEILCTDETLITKEFINRIREQGLVVILRGEGQASWVTLDGRNLEAPPENGEPTTLAEFITNGLALNTPSEGDMNGGINGGINGGGITGPSYTADEIKKMLSDEQLNLAKLQVQRKQAALDLEKLQKKLDNATVTSTLNGIVTTLRDPSEELSSMDPLMVVGNTEGLYLKGSINELDLGRLNVGDTITANSWMSGAVFTATIREISPYPDSGNNFNYGYNPNSSSYPFIAYIDNAEGLTENEMVSISSDNSAIAMGDMGNIFIFKAYVRDEGGKSYVYKTDENGRLQKVYVETGKLLYSNYIEIKDGSITDADYLAFPYDKDIKEGLKTKITTDVYY